MSKFEQEGVDRQYRARTLNAAKRALHYSCNKCSITGRYKNCKSCAISCAHHDVVTFVLNV